MNFVTFQYKTKEYDDFHRKGNGTLTGKKKFPLSMSNRFFFLTLHQFIKIMLHFNIVLYSSYGFFKPSLRIYG